MFNFGFNLARFTFWLFFLLWVTKQEINQILLTHLSYAMSAQWSSIKQSYLHSCSNMYDIQSQHVWISYTSCNSWDQNLLKCRKNETSLMSLRLWILYSPSTVYNIEYEFKSSSNWRLWISNSSLKRILYILFQTPLLQMHIYTRRHCSILYKNLIKIQRKLSYFFKQCFSQNEATVLQSILWIFSYIFFKE